MFLPWRMLGRVFGSTVSGRDRDLEASLVDRKTTELLARIAHEIRQPLSVARTAAALIRDAPDDAQRERASVVLDRQFVRLARLFDDLLQTSRSRIGTTVLRVEQVDLCRVVDEVAESVRPQVLEKRQHLTTQWPNNPVWIEADAVRLEQVVSNLLVNGITYTQPGGQVSIDIARIAGCAVLTISDTGRGIAPEFLPHIFEPFTTGDAGAEHGLGVGLDIARHLVELHGGTIRASSRGPGNGSEFIVTLPTRPPKCCGEDFPQTESGPGARRAS